MPKNDSFTDKVLKSLSNTANDIIRPFLAGPEGGSGTGFSQGSDNPGISGLAQSTLSKDIIIVPNSGTATSVYSYSQIDFKLLARQNSYANLDNNEIKVSLYNYGERVAGNTFDTPMLVMGGSWGGTTWAPAANWGLGTTTSIGPGFVDYQNGNGNLIYFKPASSAVYASLVNDVGLYSDQTAKTITFRAFNSPIPGSLSVPSTTVIFGGSGASNTLQIEGSAVEAQNVNVRFRSPFSVLNSTATDTLTLGLSSSSTGGTIYFSGGNKPKYVLSTESSSFTSGDIFYAGTGNTLIRVAIGSTNQVLVVGSGVNKTPVWSSIGGSSINLQDQSGIVSSSGEGWTYYPVLSSSLSATDKVVGTDSSLQYNIGNDTLTAGRVVATNSIGPVGNGISAAGIAASTWIIPVRSSGTGTTNGIIVLDNNNSSILFQRADSIGTIRSQISLTQWAINTNLYAGALNVNGTVSIGRTSTTVAHTTNQTIVMGSSTVLSQTALGTGVTGSSLTKVGTITEGTWSGTSISSLYGGIGNQTPYTVGDILYAGSSTTVGKLSAGTNGYILTSAGTAATPTYKDPATFTVGTASTSTRSNTVDINTTNVSTDHFLVLTSSSSSSSGTAVSTTDGISINPNANTITATSFIGNLSGVANTANNMRVIDADAGSGDHWILISTPDTGSGVAVSADTNFKFDPAKNQVSVPFITGTAFTADELTGTIQTDTQNKITSASSLATVGNISTGTWRSTAIGVTYGGTGSDLSGSGHTNRIPVVGSSAPFAMSSISNNNTGNLLVSQGIGAAPSFTNSSSADFTFSGTLNASTLAISSGTRSSAVSAPNDLVTKAYVDSLSAGILPKGIIKYTTTAGIAASYRKASSIANSNSDIGGFLISTAIDSLVFNESGFDQIGADPLVGDRILVKNGIHGGFGSAGDPYIPFSQVPSTGSFGSSYIANGLYIVHSVGSGSSNWILVRDELADTNSELRNGTYVFIDQGNTFADYSFICDLTSQPSFGSTQITFTEFSQATGIDVEQGLLKSGQTIATRANLDVSDISGVRYRSLTLGGVKTGSIGHSTWPSFKITNDNATNTLATLTNKASSFVLSAGDSAKTLTVEDNVKFSGNQGLTVTTAANKLTFAQDADFDVVFESDDDTFTLSSIENALTIASAGNGFTFDDTLGSNTTLRLSAIRNTSYLQARGQLQLRASGTDVAENYFINNGQTQYQLSTTSSSFAAGDIFYSSGVGHSSLNRLAIGAATGASVLLKIAGQPTWGRISLTDTTNHITGTLGLSSGGTNATSSDFSENGILVANGTKLKSATGLTYISGVGLSITGTVSSSGNIVSSGNFFSGVNRLPIGTGSESRISYWSDQNTLTSSDTLTYIPNATSGAALTIAPTSTAATAVRINGSNTSGNLFEVMNSGTSRLSLKFDGPINLNSASATDDVISVDGANTSGSLFMLKNSTSPRFYVNYDGNTTISSLGNTAFTIYGGRTILSSATTDFASLNIPVSNSNNNPGAGNTYDGDLWYNGTNLYFQSSTELYDLLNTGTVQGSGIENYLAKWSTGTGLTHAQIIDAVGLGVTITSLSEGVGSGAGATAYLTIQSVSADQTSEKQYSTYFVRGVKEDGTRMFSVDVSGHLRATTKSFDIPHPTKPGRRLVYGVLEGPEHGVYHRGTVEGNGKITVILPDYWSKLVGINYTIQLTPWGNYNLMIVDKNDMQFTVGLTGMPWLNKNKLYKFDYIVHGSRKDAPLDIEQ